MMVSIRSAAGSGAGLGTDTSAAVRATSCLPGGTGLPACPDRPGGLSHKTRNRGRVRKRSGAVILQERLLCSSVTNRRSVAASCPLVSALERNSRFSAAYSLSMAGSRAASSSKRCCPALRSASIARARVPCCSSCLPSAAALVCQYATSEWRAASRPATFRSSLPGSPGAR